MKPSTEGKQYLVSAIVSTYNSERFIRGCLEDLETQTIAEQLEIIVVDSGSRQNERAIVEEFQLRYNNIVYIRTEQREGLYAAWNRGIRAACGQYITNANTDDRHKSDAFKRMVTVLEARPEIALVYGNVYVTKTENETFEKHTCIGKSRYADFDPLELVDRCFIGPQPMWRKSVHEKFGYFDESFESAGDWEFWLRIAETETFLHLDEFLGLYLKSPTSVEHRNIALSRSEMLRIRQSYFSRVAHLEATSNFGFNNLEVGQRVKVRGRLGENGVFLALDISVESPADDVVVEGLIQSIDHQTKTLRLLNCDFILPDGIAVRDLQHHAIALFDLDAGDVVKLKGKYSEQKGLLPTKVKKMTTDFNFTKLVGVIQKVDRKTKILEVMGFKVVVDEQDTIFWKTLGIKTSRKFDD